MDIIINLDKIETFDNLLIEKLLKIQEHCQKRNCSVSLCGVKHDVLCLFYLLKLDKYFEFYENENEACLRKNRLVKRRLKVV